MQKTKQIASGLCVLFITSDTSSSNDLLQKLNSSGCVVNQIKAGKKLKKQNYQAFYDISVIELDQLTPELLEMCRNLITELALLDTPTIVITSPQDITTVKNELWALPLVYFIQRDSSVEKKVIAQANYLNYLRNRYN